MARLGAVWRSHVRHGMGIVVPSEVWSGEMRLGGAVIRQGFQGEEKWQR